MPGSLKSNLLLGLAAGLAATAAMDAYWKALRTLQPEAMAANSHEEPTTVKVARRALRRVGVAKPSSQTRAIGGQMVHWGYGASWGLITGLARAADIRLDWGFGQLLGAGLWAGGDIWMLYRLDLARHPREYPARVHASALGAHLAYGLALWATVESLGKLQKPRRRFIRSAA